VPFDPGILSLESYKGLEMLMKEVSEFAQTEKLPSGAIVTQYRSPLLSWFKKKPSEPLIRSLDAKFKRLFVVPYSREISKAQVAGIPIGLFAPKTKTSMVYNQVAQYIEEICYGNK
jgi:nitrogenase subunit NifH